MSRRAASRRLSMSTASLNGIAREVFRIEADAIRALGKNIGKSAFVKAVTLLYACKGHVVVTGVGKSGHVGRKIAATLASTGTPAFYLHAAEAVHGDLGMIGGADIILALSYSGETDELRALLPALRRMGNLMVAVTGNPRSSLARSSDAVLDIHVRQEACPMDLAPTASTTVTLAMGDALAVALLKLRKFTRRDFAKFHPHGTLGRKLLTRVSDVMHTGKAVPVVKSSATMSEVIVEISGKRLGLTTVLDGRGRIAGVITDGDLRRGLQTHEDFMRARAGEVCSRNPKTISKDSLATRALAVMEANAITSLIVADSRGRIHGCIHIHDLLKAGIV